MAVMTPAVAHALLTGHPDRAAAIHVLDGIDSPIFPRAVVTMDGIDWAAIADRASALSSGEYILVVAAQQLDGRGRVGWSTLEECRQRVDRAGNVRLDEAMDMVGQRIPLDWFLAEARWWADHWRHGAVNILEAALPDGYSHSGADPFLWEDRQ